VAFQGIGHNSAATFNPNGGTTTIVFDVTRRIFGDGGQPMPAATTVPRSYIAELQRGNVGVNCVWKEATLEQLAEFETEVLRVSEEKARAFWRLWVDLHEPQLEPWDTREKAGRFAARHLRVYPWFKGDETITEAMEAVRRINAAYGEFTTRDRAGGPTRFLMAPNTNNRTMPPSGVVPPTMVSQAEARMRTEGGTHPQAQVREVEDEEE
jgi:hypothetical protein